MRPFQLKLDEVPAHNANSNGVEVLLYDNFARASHIRTALCFAEDLTRLTVPSTVERDDVGVRVNLEEALDLRDAGAFHENIGVTVLSEASPTGATSRSPMGA
ncbi:hypothetical protein DL767_010166 [Monosporascus sp. MG133]|nr:hypothetical protein DL767_010166 [Monosporascus sp. MG133]